MSVTRRKCRYEITVTARDYFGSAEQDFTLILYNQQPFQFKTLAIIERHAGVFVEIQIADSVFVDPDSDDTLQYFIATSQLPSYLQLNSQIGRISGLSQVQDLTTNCAPGTVGQVDVPDLPTMFGYSIKIKKDTCTHTMTVRFTDQKEENTGTLVLVLSNHYPYYYRPLYKDGSDPDNLIRVKSGDQFQLTMPGDLFLDLDNDILEYTLVNKTDGGAPPLWIQIFSSTRKIFITPTSKVMQDFCPFGVKTERQVTVDHLSRQIAGVNLTECSFDFTLIGTDIFGKSNQTDFTVVLQNYQPFQYHFVHNVSNAETPIEVEVNKQLTYEMSEFIFQDLNKNDKISYQILHQNGSELPYWIEVDYISQVLQVEAPLDALYDCPSTGGAPDSYTATETILNQSLADLTVLFCDYPLTYHVGDGFYKNTVNFTIRIINYIPNRVHPIYLNEEGEPVMRIHYRKPIDYTIPENIIQDFKQDALEFRANLVTGGGTLENLPQWLYYSEWENKLQGSAADADFFQHCANQTVLVPVSNVTGGALETVQIYCEFLIRITANDARNEEEYQEFTMVVYDNSPFNFSFVSEDQYFFPNTLHVQTQEMVLFSIPNNVFSDTDELDSQYISVLQEDGSEIQEWMSYSPQSFTLFFSPTESVLYDDCPSIQLNTTSERDYLNNSITVTQKYCVYRYRVFCTDEVLTINQSLTIIIYNNLPYVHSPIILDQSPDIQTHVMSTFSLYLVYNAFKDMDKNDFLQIRSYRINDDPIPQWLSYYTDLRKYIGIPQKRDLYSDQCALNLTTYTAMNQQNTHLITINSTCCKYELNVMAIDYRDSVNQTFNVSVCNISPYPNVDLSDFNFTVHTNVFFDYVFPENSFWDLDTNDRLTYRVKEGTMPEWLNFQQEIRRFSGTPTKSDLNASTCANYFVDEIEVPSNVPGVPTKTNKTWCNSTVVVRVTDGYCEEDIEQAINVSVYNSDPYIKYPISVQLNNPFSNISLHVSQYLDFTFDKETFVDPDEEDELTYDAYLAGNVMLPYWLKFNAKTRRLYGRPQLEDLYTKCSRRDEVIHTRMNVLNDTVTFKEIICQLDVDIQVFDGTNTLHQLLIVIFRDKSPWLLTPVYTTQGDVISFNDTFAVHVGSQFSFILPSVTIKDEDPEDKFYVEIQVNESSMPDWLKYNIDERRFIGTPYHFSSIDAENTYRIELIATDQFLSINTYFLIWVYNHPPLAVPSTTYNFTYDFDEPIQIFFNFTDIYDVDLDKLKYFIEVRRDADGVWDFAQNVVSWINFDTEGLIIFGKFTDYDKVPANASTGIYYKHYAVRLVGSDIVDERAYVNVDIHIQHLGIAIKTDKTLQQQFDSVMAKKLTRTKPMEEFSF